MRRQRLVRIAIAITALLIGGAAIYFGALIDRTNQPLCHKQIVMALEGWKDARKTQSFPNIQGLSSNSLAAARDEWGGLPVEENYNYVPGLREGDPSNLVLLYLKHPTRWRWHGMPRTVFRRKAWIILCVDPHSIDVPAGVEVGELSESISPDEFRKRLQQTLDFLRTNERPNWQTVVAEQTQFLQNIEDEGK